MADRLQLKRSFDRRTFCRSDGFKSAGLNLRLFVFILVFRPAPWRSQRRTSSKKFILVLEYLCPLPSMPCKFHLPR